MNTVHRTCLLTADLYLGRYYIPMYGQVENYYLSILNRKRIDISARSLK